MLEQNLPEEIVETIDRLSQNRETGIFRIDTEKEGITLLLQGGKIPHGYLETEGTHHRIQKEGWQNLLATGDDCRFTFVPSPSATLLAQKVLIEHQNSSEEKRNQTNQLASLIHSASALPTATLQHIKWENAEAFVINAGIELTHRKVILVSGSQVTTTQDALESLFNWHEKQCVIKTYEGDIQNQAWIELYLNILFEWACNYIFTQYSYLTGKIMINSVIRGLLIKAAQEGWDISAIDGVVTNHTIFVSPADSARAYHAMLTNIKKSIEPVIGPVLTYTIQRQLTPLCKGSYQTIAQMYELFS